ncbi:hypothetical protein BU15DRAFT_83230 [Melanogaster broomeanus]|nr:hypothetical protein BU15DRAFT_83230 [Melanogaster broomeanus]
MPILPLPPSSPLVTATSHHAPVMVVAGAGLRRLTAVHTVRSGLDLGTLTTTDDVAVAGSSNHSRGSSPTLVTVRTAQRTGHHYMDAAFSADPTMRDATSQRESYWEELFHSCRGERRPSGLEQCLDKLEDANQSLREDLELADDRLTQERARAACSDETIESLERRVADLQRELRAAREPRGFPDRGVASFPQWGRGGVDTPANFPSQRPQDGQGNAVAGPSTSREQPTPSREQAQAATRGQEVRPLETEARPSTSGPTTGEPSSRPSRPRSFSDTLLNATAMRLIGDSVVLTVDKREFAFSGEAAKKATVAYQKRHMPPVSLRVRHWGDWASPTDVQRYGQMLATASELGKNLSDAQAYGLARWRGLSRHNPVTGPSMGPAQVPGAPTPPTTTRGIASSHTGPTPGTRAPKVAQPTYNDPPSAWMEWLKVYDCHRTGVLVYEDGTRSVRAMRGSMLMACMQPSVGSSSSRQHFIQQAALLLMLPGQYRAITERFDISISATHGISGYYLERGGRRVLVRLYARPPPAHQRYPLPEVIRQGLQAYEIRVRSAELATWYIEVLPSGMAPALSRVGPALVEAFAVPSGTVVPPGEANSTHAAHIPGPQDQDQEMDGPPVSSESGAVEPSLGNTTVTVVPPGVVPMEVEPGELPSASEPELAQEGEGVKGA